MNFATWNGILEHVKRTAVPLDGTSADHDALLRIVGDARFVLLGEATHGTHEFYRERARITRRLIEEKGFCAVAVEADWPDAGRVNRWVRHRGDAVDGRAALGGFRRFPTWMWRNADVLEFIEWLRGHNAGAFRDMADRGRAEQPLVRRPAGFYGLDLYSLHASVEAVLHYLEKVDVEAARRARFRYGCFDHFGEDTQAYGYAATFGMSESCESEVTRQLVEMQQNAPRYLHLDGHLAEDEYFFAEQNARLVKNAENYYRTMFSGRASSWNLRDRHMADNLVALAEHLARRTDPVKIVVWAHNSHLGDARATEMSRSGELNVGQLVRERFPGECVLVGFTTHHGTVTAAEDWDGPTLQRRVRPALAGSVEDIFHQADTPRFFLPLARAEPLDAPLLERAIGVVYRPETERLSHYFQCRLSRQFDAVYHLEETNAVQPLDVTQRWHVGEEVPESIRQG